jgi:hypothetical protein
MTSTRKYAYLWDSLQPLEEPAVLTIPRLPLNRQHSLEDSEGLYIL